MATFSVLLLATFCGLAATGVLDSKWLQQDAARWQRFNPVMGRPMEGRMMSDPLTRMTGNELMRQKFILKLLDHVHHRLNDEEIENMPDMFVDLGASYRGGLDQDMVHVIELCKNGQLVGKEQMYRVADPTNLRQMIGLYHLLVRSMKWETFMQNARCARNHMNGVLFVNALLLAVREREDTRQLILPAIYEILPELYIDQNALRIARNIDINLLTTSTHRDTYRPSLFDMIGVGNRWNRKDTIMGQRAGNRNVVEPTNKIIIDSEQLNKEEFGMELVTEDVALKGFLNYMINDICLKEREISEESKNRVGMTNSRTLMHDDGRYDLSMECKRCIDEHTMIDCRICARNMSIELPNSCMRCINNGIGQDCEMCQKVMRPDRNIERIDYDMNRKWRDDRFNPNVMSDTRSTSINSDRLLHINRRKMQPMNEMHEMRRLLTDDDRDLKHVDDMTMDMGTMRDRLSDDWVLLDRLHDSCKICIMERSGEDCTRCLSMSGSDELRQLGSPCMICIERQADRDCHMCIEGMHRNRMDDSKRSIMHEVSPQRLSPNCKRCIDERTVTDCKTCIMTMNIEQLHNMPMSCVHCMHNRIDDDCNMCRNMMQANMNSDESRFDTRYDVNSRRDPPTTVINDDRLLHINPRKLNTVSDMNRIDSEQPDVMIHRIADGRQIQRDDELSPKCRTCIVERTAIACQACLRETSIEMLRNMPRECLQCIHHRLTTDCDLCQTVIPRNRLNDNSVESGNSNMAGLATKSIDNDRLLHINRRRLNAIQNRDVMDNAMINGNKRERFMNVLERFNSGPNVKPNDDNIDMTMGRVNLERNSGHGTFSQHMMNDAMNRQFSQDRKRISIENDMNLNNLNTDCMSCIDRRSLIDCKNCLTNLDLDLFRILPIQCLQCMHHRTASACNYCQTIFPDVTIPREEVQQFRDMLRQTESGPTTTTINDDRLLHVNRKKLNAINKNVIDENMDTRVKGMEGRLDVDDGAEFKRTDDMNTMERADIMDRMSDAVVMDSQGLSMDCLDCINQRTLTACNNCIMSSDMKMLHSLDGSCLRCINHRSVSDCDMCQNRLLDGMTPDTQMHMNEERFLPTTSMNDDRLLHVSRRRVPRSIHLKMNSQSLDNADGRKNKKMEMRGRAGRSKSKKEQSPNDSDCSMCIMDGDALGCNACQTKSDMGVYRSTHKECMKCKVGRLDKDCDKCMHILNMSHNLMSANTFSLKSDCESCIVSRDANDCNLCQMRMDTSDWSGLHGKCLACIYRQNAMDCESCQNVMHIERPKAMAEHDFVMQRDDIKGRLNDVCINCINKMTEDDCERCLRTTDDIVLSRLNDDCLDCIHQRTDRGCRICRIEIDSKSPNVQRFTTSIHNDNDDDLMRRGTSHIAEVDRNDNRELITTTDIVLHNLRQLVTRINLERISLGLSLRSFSQNIHMQESIKETDAQQLLHNLKPDRPLNEIDVEREISKAMLSRDGANSILSILADRSSDPSQALLDLSDTQNLGVLQELLQRMDKVRTQILGSYKRNDLALSDVRINDITVDPLVTRTERGDIDLRNILDQSDRVVMLRQRKLTHKDFSIRINVESERNQRVVVRTFLGPKRRNEFSHRLDLALNGGDFMLLDTNIVDLITGRNLIERKSRQLHWTAMDTTPLSDIYERVMLAERGEHNSMNLMGMITIGQDCRFPHRLILPRGRYDGMDMELIVVITPADNKSVPMSVSDSIIKCSMGIGVPAVDHHSLGFPLDRLIDDSLDLNTFSNIRSIDIKIYHEDQQL